MLATCGEIVRLERADDLSFAITLLEQLKILSTSSTDVQSVLGLELVVKLQSDDLVAAFSIFQTLANDACQRSETSEAITAVSSKSATSCGALLLHAAGRCSSISHLRDAIVTIISQTWFLELPADTWSEFFTALGTQPTVVESVLRLFLQSLLTETTSWGNATISTMLVASNVWATTWSRHDEVAFQHDSLCDPNFWVWAVLRRLHLELTKRIGKNASSHNAAGVLHEQYSAIFSSLGQCLLLLVAQNKKETPVPLATEHQPSPIDATACVGLPERGIGFLHVIRDFVGLALGEHSDLLLQLRLAILQMCHMTILEMDREGGVKQLTAAISKLCPQAVFAETMYFQRNFQFCNKLQRFTMCPNLRAQMLPTNSADADALTLSLAEMNLSVILFLVSGCLTEQFDAVVDALSSQKMLLENCVTELFIAWMVMSAHSMPPQVKDCALAMYAENASFDQQGNVIRFIAASVNTLRERALRQKWCRYALKLLHGRQGNSSKNTQKLELVVKEGFSSEPEIQECIQSIAVSAFNDGVGYSRETYFMEAEQSMSVAVSLLAPLPASELKQAVAAGYETILRLLQRSSASCSGSACTSASIA